MHAEHKHKRRDWKFFIILIYRWPVVSNLLILCEISPVLIPGKKSYDNRNCMTVGKEKESD